MDGIPPPARSQRPAGRAYIGLGVLGCGLAILVGAVPHEDPIVGIALAAFGTALVATAPRLPDIRLPPLAAGLAGLLLALPVAAHAAWRGGAWSVPKVALVALGLALAGLAPLLARDVHVRLGRRRVPLATLAACLLPVLGAPLLAWGVQALFKGSLGTTPVELFVRVALLPPLAGFLAVLGLGPQVDGQTIHYATPRGPLSLEVGAACSGIQAMALFAGVLTLFLLAERPGGRRLALWSFIGLGGVYVANVVRLFSLALVGYGWGPAALLRAHAEAGWIFFVAWAVLFAYLARRSGNPRPAQP
ncbi:MAG TPA: exosortase/archaeosortase family protein [Candidatus Thermoplasmatota archaeon]|nr:exosortase/archaeosortase family protein [Candidatus Thermoplasmatota archaeon]